LIADSLQGFVKALEAIFILTREHSFTPEMKPITADDRNETLEEIRIHNPKADLEFWGIWLAEE
jgi:hypothetical protein